MVYILANERDNSSFGSSGDRYRKYLEENKSKFPKNAYELATSTWWFDFSNHKCPHDSWLEKISIVEPAEGERNEKRSTNIEVKLLGAYHDGYIKLKYRNVTSFKIDAFNVKEGHSDWCYDEFRISSNNLLIHEIEWSGYQDASNWLIESEDIEYSWEDI